MQKLFEETEIVDLLETRTELYMCKSCGAFGNSSSIECGICGTQSKEIIKALSNENILTESTMSKILSPGVLIICRECGAFLGQDAKICTICGTSNPKEGFQEKDELFAEIKTRLRGNKEGVKTPDSFPRPKRKIRKKVPPKILIKRTKAEIVEDLKKLLHKKAMTLKKLGRHKESLESLNKILGLEKDNEKIKLEKADLYYDIGCYRQAAKLYRNLLGSNPKNTVLWNRLGNALFRMGNQKESLLFYDKALSLDSNNAEALINKGYILMKQEKYDRARVYTKQITV